MKGPLPNLADYGVALVFFFAFGSYVVGAVIHLGAGTVERIRKKKWGGFPGVTMLSQGDDRLASAFKQNLRERILADFRLDLSSTTKRERDENTNEAFDLCYSWLQARGLAAAPRRHELEYQLLRNMQLAAALTLVIGLSLVLQILASITQQRETSLLWHDGVFNWVLVGVALIFVTTSVFFVAFTADKIKALLTRFCASVYQTYYAVRTLEK
jgi:hypothetical protein